MSESTFHALEFAVPTPLFGLPAHSSLLLLFTSTTSVHFYCRLSVAASSHNKQHLGSRSDLSNALAKCFLCHVCHPPVEKIAFHMGGNMPVGCIGKSSYNVDSCRNMTTRSDQPLPYSTSLGTITWTTGPALQARYLWISEKNYNSFFS